ncbi:MAG: peptidase T, partial [Anaerolineaceae bacterium]
MATVKERFLNYVKVNTKSDLESETTPSTPEQFNLAHLLVDEMKALGLEEITLDENCYIMATLPANTTKKIPTMGLIAHMDTSPDMSGEGVNPQIIANYDGGDIVLNKEAGIVMTLDMFPELAKYKGQELIT